MEHTIIPAHCPYCGAVFESRFFGKLGNIKRLTLSGNQETCPFCGKLANIAEGVFEIADNVISVISAPHITTEMLAALSGVVKKAYQEKSKPEEVAKVAESIDPSFGYVIRAISSNKTFYLVGLLLILVTIRSCNLNINLDANKLVDQLSERPPEKVISEQTIEI